MRKKITLVTALAFAAAISAGFGMANVQADAATEKGGFAITATSVRLDDANKEGVDSGLRFKVECPDAKADVTNAYTKLIVTPVGGTTKVTNVPATVWRSAGDGWNTVLLDIPDTDYVTEVTAQAFVTVGGVEYQTAPVTSTIAKAAAMAMATGVATEAQVGHYVALTSITLDKETATLAQGETLTLAATTAPAGYAVKYTSSNEAVATVDANGVVTAVGGGRVTITASMGGAEATCEVLVTGAATIVDFNNDSPMVAGYTTAGNGSAIQSYYGYNASGSKVPVGYSGLTTGDQILYQTAGGVTGTDKALAFNYFWRTVNGDPWKVGFATAWLDAVFADLHVSALQWSMKVGNGSSITGIATDVEQSWTDDMVIDAQWHTLTMTREDYYAIKAANNLTVDGFLSISVTKAGTNYSAAFWWLFDEFQVVYSAEEAEEFVPAPTPAVLTLDFNNSALGAADSTKYYLSNATGDDSVTINTYGYGELVNNDTSVDEKALKFYMSANTARQYMYVNIVLTDDMKAAIANGATLSFAYAINRCKSSQYTTFSLSAGANGGSTTQELFSSTNVGYDSAGNTWGPRAYDSANTAFAQWQTLTITDATVLSELASTGILQIIVNANNWKNKHETNFWIDNITVVSE